MQASPLNAKDFLLMNTNGTTATPICDALRASGNWNPNWDPFAKLDPAWTEQFMAVGMGMAPMISGVLDAKTIEFIAIAVDASCTHLYAPGVRRHIGKALELGACVSVLGIHTMSLAAPILIEEAAAYESRVEATPTISR
jgi:alkylhydroperoxidase/carboxymuconolactone decarboxylase family protein YurZ